MAVSEMTTNCRVREPTLVDAKCSVVVHCNAHNCRPEIVYAIRNKLIAILESFEKVYEPIEPSIIFFC